MFQFSRAKELLLPIGVLVCLFVVLAPLPSFVMDFLLIGNVALSVIILLTTIQIAAPLEFSVFPTVLLATTLGRLVLNIATTRLILTRAADDGLEAAGGVIRSFGEFVAGDEILVGLVIFAIVAVIQFVVITKGSSRISEVSARFALDGMPGKQMAVDADLSAGLIDESEARRRRHEISQQAAFYGAMDGASKFVRGDAIASVFITMINIAGGLVLGVVRFGMGPGEAVSVFTKLTIGDGLVSQLPALLISLAAGLLVTRSTERANLPLEFLRQLVASPQVLAVSGVFLGLLVLTQLPAVPLLMLGGSCVGAAVMMGRKSTVNPEKPATSAPDVKTPQPQKAEPRIEEYLTVDPVELELGLELVRLADSKRGGNLLSRITQLRQAVAADLGLVLPKVRIRDNLRLPEDAYRIKIQGNPVALAQLPTGAYWGVGMPATERRSGGSLEHPAFTQPLRRLARDQVAAIQSQGTTVLDSTAVLLHHLRQVVSEHAEELLTRDAAKHLVEETRRQAPAVVDELIPEVMKLADVQRILQRLLSEGISIRQLSTILETLGDEASRTRSEIELTERVRQRLSRSICAQYRDQRDRLHAITLDPALEERLQRSAAVKDRDVTVHWTAPQIDSLCRQIDAALHELRQAERPEVLLVRPEIRPIVRRLIRATLPQVVVLSYGEITADTRVVSLGIVSGAKEVG